MTERTTSQWKKEVARGAETWLYDKQASCSREHPQLVDLYYLYYFEYLFSIDEQVSK